MRWFALLVVFSACAPEKVWEDPTLVVDTTDTVVDTVDTIDIDTDPPDTDQPDTDPPDTAPPVSAEDCTNGSDDDGDGLPDCEDADCFNIRVCDEMVCDDEQDDDLDGLVDCEDDDCWGLSHCRRVRQITANNIFLYRWDYSSMLACSPGMAPPPGQGTVYAESSMATSIEMGGIESRVTDRVTGSVCTWTASGVGIYAYSYGSPTATRVGFGGLVPPTNCGMPNTAGFPLYVHLMQSSATQRLQLLSVDSLAAPISMGRRFLTMDLMRLNGAAYASSSTYASSYPFPNAVCRWRYSSVSSSFSGTIVP